MVVFVDVDDTLIRSVGPKRIPIPRVVDRVRSLHGDGHNSISGVLPVLTTLDRQPPSSDSLSASPGSCPSQTSSSTTNRLPSGEHVPMSTLSQRKSPPPNPRRCAPRPPLNLAVVTLSK